MYEFHRYEINPQTVEEYNKLPWKNKTKTKEGTPWTLTWLTKQNQERLRSLDNSTMSYPAPEQACNKKGKPMSYNNAAAAIYAPADTTEKDQRRYLRDRLYTLRSNKKDEARRTFGLEDDKAPESPKELAQRIADGKFIINSLDKDDNRYFYWTDSLRWRDPSVKEDSAGYKAFKEALDVEFQKAEDIIRILPPVDGLKAVQEFETWTYAAK